MGWTVLTGEFSGQSTTVGDCSTAWGTCTSQSDAEAEIKRIVEWLTTLKKSGCKGVTLGLSGGKDSTVVAMLAIKVWGRENVHGIIMPNHNWDDVEDALSIARALRIKYFQLSLLLRHRKSL